MNDTVIPLEAIRLYVLYGTLARVSRELDIPMRELQAASRTPWWQDEVILLRRAQAAVLDAELTKLHGRTIEELIDRVENGERWRNKAGKEVRVPMKSRDIAAIAHIIFTERQLLRNEPTAIQGDTSKVHALADKLRTLGKSLAPPDVEDVNAQEAS